ncbi:cell division protein ZapE [Eilatimonas milleporae]|uniref:Cell division protein ZapE n=1 Tax=Eilatimonas milleporae TaxID=911205 RepID=A0A3M0CLH2_9PROT|nr:cell division protein ZapE [Eilatimonas milleporae]RMB07796.1 cell division protein ZapE [Eilatimonas milleporae]
MSRPDDQSDSAISGRGSGPETDSDTRPDMHSDSRSGNHSGNRLGGVPGTNPRETYDRMRADGELREDAAQAGLVDRLQRLHDDLEGYPDIGGRARGLTIKSWRLFNRFRWSGGDRTPPRSLYIHGGVGRGKSLLMDLFFATAPVGAKRRVHFHDFMLDVHARLKEWRALGPRERVDRGGRASSDDPVPPVARQIACEATLLCFDELQVTDIADAMVLGRLFRELMELGVVVVATSNRPPEDLYKNGLNRQLFLPFIHMIKARFDVVGLNGPTDYRLDRMKGVKTYYTPVDAETTAALREVFFRLTDCHDDDPARVPSDTLTVQGRTLFVPKAAKGVAVFSFKRLCARPLGAADYLAVARRFHTVIVVAIPQMGPEKRNEAKRFVTLIDALYEHGVKLLCSAAVPPDDLYVSGDGVFEFERTASRLHEMQSETYLARPHGVPESAPA